MPEVTDRDRELAAYWTERGDLRAWLANIIAHVRDEGRREALEAAPSDAEIKEAIWKFTITIGGDEEVMRTAIAAALRVRAGKA